MNRWRQAMVEQKGQSLIEFALVVPLLLLLLCGIFDIGRLMYGYLHLNLAAQEAVRMGGLGKADSEITTFARNYVHLGNAASLQITVTPNDTNRKSGEYVTVQLRYPLTYLTPLVANILPPPVISADSTIRVE